MKNNPDTLVGDNIVEHAKHVQKAQDTLLSHFNSKSKLMRAVQDHLLYAKDCFVLDKGGREAHRLGCIRVNDVVAPYAGPGECQMLIIRCTVALSPLETDYPEYDLGNDVEKPMDIYAPSDLELKFTVDKFKLWLGTVRDKRSKTDYGKNLEMLKEMIRKYPAVAKEAFGTVTRQRRKKSR